MRNLFSKKNKKRLIQVPSALELWAGKELYYIIYKMYLGMFTYYASLFSIVHAGCGRRPQAPGVGGRQPTDLAMADPTLEQWLYGGVGSHWPEVPSWFPTNVL